MSKFKNLKFKIYELDKDVDLREKFPELNKYKVISKNKYPNINYVLRYIIFLHDPETDLLRDIPDLMSRKRAAALLAGFTDETPELTSIMEHKEPRIVDLIQCFLTEVYHNRDYREWTTLQQELDEATRLRLKALDEKTNDTEEDVDLFKAMDLKGKLRTQCEMIHKKLDILDPKIFGGDLKLQEAAYVSRFTTPEAWSKQMQPVMSE